MYKPIGKISHNAREVMFVLYLFYIYPENIKKLLNNNAVRKFIKSKNKNIPGSLMNNNNSSSIIILINNNSKQLMLPLCPQIIRIQSMRRWKFG